MNNISGLKPKGTIHWVCDYDVIDVVDINLTITDNKIINIWIEKKSFAEKGMSNNTVQFIRHGYYNYYNGKYLKLVGLKNSYENKKS